MFEIITPINKVERVSRSITPNTFVAAPGTWAKLEANGSLLNVADGVTDSANQYMFKLVIGSSSANAYESHDIEVGRIATMESYGIRCKVDSVGFTGAPTFGDMLVVSSDTDEMGKLISVEDAIAGTYEIVARCEGISSTELTFKTVSPVYTTIP